MNHSLLAYSQNCLKLCLARELQLWRLNRKRNIWFGVPSLENFNPPSDEDAHFVDTLIKRLWKPCSLLRNFTVISPLTFGKGAKNKQTTKTKISEVLLRHLNFHYLGYATGSKGRIDPCWCSSTLSLLK